MTEVKAIVFDMDGILLDSESVWDIVWKKYSLEQGLDHIDEAISACRGCNSQDQQIVLKQIYGDSFNAEDFFKSALSLFYKYEKEKGIPVKYFAEQILRYLKNKGYKVALASSTGRVAVERQMKNAKLWNFFDKVICGDELEHSKPAPDIYLLACRQLEVNPSECIAVEDSPNGIKSAFNAGMRCVMVPDKVPYSESLKPLLWKKIDTLEQLTSIL